MLRRASARSAAALAVLCCGAPALGAQEPVHHIKSAHSVETTVERAERIASYHGMRILGVIDYAEVGAPWLSDKTMAPARLIVFMDDRGVVPRAVLENRLLALEMPLKLLVWRDDKGGVWVSYRKLADVAGVSPNLLAKLDDLAKAFGDEAAR